MVSRVTPCSYKRFGETHRLCLNPEDGSSTFLRSVGNYKTSQPTRPLWEPQISGTDVTYVAGFRQKDMDTNRLAASKAL
jgi:hypothetical protein